MSRGPKRDLAQAIVESRDDLPPWFVDREIVLLHTFTADVNGSSVADLDIATWHKGYRSLWHKHMTQAKPAWTEDEKRYLDLYHELMPRASIRAMSEGTSGGLAIPPDISSAIIISATLDDAAILAYSPPRWTTSDVWKGISTAGSGFQLPGEGVVVADNTPTFTQPSVTIFAAKDFIPFSLEVGADYPDFANEMGRLFGAEYRDRISNDTAVGVGGSTAPEGIFTRMAATTAGSGAAHVTVTTPGSICGADVRAIWAALPERAKNDPSCAWMMSNSVFQQISALAAPSTSAGLAPEDVKHVPGMGSYIFGKPVIYSSYAPAFTGTSGAANYTVVGSFSRYAIVQRVGGLTSELIPQLLDFAGGTGRPTGQSGYLAIARYGAECLDVSAFRLLANS
jgi:HK97 family phage major capsid protein